MRKIKSPWPIPTSVASLSFSAPSQLTHSFHLVMSQAAALCAPRASAAAADGVPEAPRSGLQQAQSHLLLRRPSSLPSSASPSSFGSSSSPSRRPSRAISAAASSTEVDRDHTAASMDSSRGQALVAWLEVRLKQ
jgi:hypothetical protein